MSSDDSGGSLAPSQKIHYVPMSFISGHIRMSIKLDMWTCFARKCSTSWHQCISWYQPPFVLDSTSPWVWLLRCFSLRQQWIQGPLQAEFGNVAWSSNLSYKTVISKGARKEMVIPHFYKHPTLQTVVVCSWQSFHAYLDFSLTPLWRSVNIDSLGP